MVFLFFLCLLLLFLFFVGFFLFLGFGLVCIGLFVCVWFDFDGVFFVFWWGVFFFFGVGVAFWVGGGCWGCLLLFGWVVGVVWGVFVLVVVGWEFVCVICLVGLVVWGLLLFVGLGGLGGCGFGVVVVLFFDRNLHRSIAVLRS